MYNLMNIKECVQQVSNAISAILNVEVEVFNSDLFRIAGTGRYIALIGKKKTNSQVLY